MFKVVILPQAKNDIHEAAQWYQTKQPGLGKRFISEVRSKVSFIERNPMACAKKCRLFMRFSHTFTSSDGMTSISILIFTR